MEQPTVYNSEKELIEWLKYDLPDQRKKIALELNIDTVDVEDKNLILNIGKKDVVINFDFNFDDIISQLPNTKDENAESICPYKINCEYVDFNGDANFIGVTFTEDANFSFATFTEDGNFSSVTFEQKSNFMYAVFKNESIFENNSFKEIADFFYTTFGQEGNFMNANFENKANFNNVIFKSKANFINTTFENEVSFYNVIFENKANFEHTEIKNTLKFDNIKLNDKSYIEFEGINYKQSKFIKPHKNSKIEIINTVINGRVDFNYVSIKEIDFTRTVVIGNGVISTDELNVQKYASWKTARFLKHEAIKISNNIETLKYKAIEKDLYQKELAGKKNKSFQTWAEIISILLSKHSNNHGQNWFKAVAFTIGYGLLFFTIYFLISNFNLATLKKFIKLFTLEPFNALQAILENYFIPLSKFYIPIDYSGIPSIINGEKTDLRDFLAIPFYLIGKIAISYGMVEVVQAFRKLK